MSLLVWLPLNGDSHNQGLGKYIEKTNTLTYTTNGKIAEKCVNSGRLFYDKNPLGMIGTICFWLYPKSTEEGNNGEPNIIFGVDPIGTGGRKWSLYMYPDNKSLHSWGCQKDGNSTYNGSFTLRNVLTESTWNHVCVAHDLQKEYVYINGNLIHTVNWDSNGTFTFDVTTPMIWSDQNDDDRKNFKMNDFRIYDTCLSKAEVKEIAKGMMLHYSFENPYVTETTNITHTLKLTAQSQTEVKQGSDSIGNYIIKNGMTAWTGLTLNDVSIKPYKYYTWSMDVMSIKDIEYVIDGNVSCVNVNHSGNDTEHFTILRGHSHAYHNVDGSDTLPKGKLEAYKWTRIYFTIKTKGCSNPYLSHTFVPYIPSGDSEVKVYYRNSQLEECTYDSPYISSKREASTIKDNSGMGNNGTQIYKRTEIPIESTTPTSAQGLTDTISGTTHAIKGFNGSTNQCIYFGTLRYNSAYHYVGAWVCYEFDVTVSDMTFVSGQTPKIYLQGATALKDGTGIWYDNPICNDDLYKLTKNATNGTYHIYLQKKITYSPGVTNVSHYTFGIRFDYIKSGTFTISNIHSYYKDLDTSKLTIANKSAVGSHSAYFNGKNYIDCGLVTPQDIDSLTLSCWAYRDDWSTLTREGSSGTALISSVNSGGFGFKIERCVAESLDTSINFVIYYKDKGYLETITSKGLCIDYSKLSSGWHLITGVADKNKATLYLDGEKVKEIVHNFNKPIYNYDTRNNKRNNLLVGAECEITVEPPKADNIYIDDVRLYSVALTDKDVKALYNTKLKIDNKSNLYCNELIETKSENLVDYSLIEPGSYGGVTWSGNYDKQNDEFTMTIVSNTSSTAGQQGPYFRAYEKYGPNHRPISGEKYRLSMWFKLPKSGEWIVGSEVLPRSRKYYEAGKWYYIEQEGNANTNVNAIIFYVYTALLEVNDKIIFKDLRFYRLYDTEYYNQEITKKGQHKTFELDETSIDKLTSYKIINKYNAIWLQVFHHDTNNNTVWFADEAEALNCNSQYKFSILDQLEGFRGSDGKFEFLLEYPQDLPNEYNRWKQTDNPVTTTEKDNSTASPANGYEAIHVDWTTSGWGGLLKSIKQGEKSRPFTFIDGVTNHNNWYYAIGCYDNSSLLPSDNNWHNKVPGAKGDTGMKEINLYVRLDEKYMGARILDKYGAEWLEVFYHDNNNCKVFFNSQTEALHTNSQYKFSILDQLEKFRGIDNKFEFLLEYPTDIPGKYNRWKQIDNPVKVIANNTYASGYEAIHVDWSDNNWGGLLKATSSSVTLLKGSIVNANTWFFAIGALKAWDSSNNYNGVPGPYTSRSDYSNPNGIVHDIHLYVRIDNLKSNDNFKIYNRKTKTNEIIEI